MTRLRFSKAFDKRYQKLTVRQQQKVDAALELFLSDPNARVLRRHELKGQWHGFFSLSAGGDLRIHCQQDSEIVLLVSVGTHSQLYK